MGKTEERKPPKKGGSYPLEDRALKEAARLFGEELMPLLGIQGKVRRVAPTEEVYLNPKDFLQDFNYEMTDGRWTHLEFESDSITTEDLRRFRTYESIISQYYKVEVTTYVICSSDGKECKDSLTEGLNTYRVKVIRLKSRNADRLLAELKRKQKKRGLEREELLEVLLSPLMGGSMGQRERIRRGMELLRGERERLDRHEAAQMEAVLYTFAMKFLSVKELKTIKEMMNMTILGEMIMQDGIEKGRREGIQEGRREGKREGKREGRREGRQEGRREGKREGRQEGKDQINQLNAILIGAGRIEDLKRASSDNVFQDRLIRELLSDEKGKKGK